jgi:mannose-6-phosphate isomerase class I
VAELVEVDRSWKSLKGTENFEILVALDAGMTVLAGESDAHLSRGGAVLVPGQVGEYHVEGPGRLLVYKVSSR